MRQDGFIVIGRDVLARLPEIGCTAMGVYLALASHADDVGHCFPSHETIAREVGVTDRTVRTALRALEGAGLVGRTHRRRQTALYEVQARKPASAQSRNEARKPASAQSRNEARKPASAQEPSPEKNDAKPGKKRPLSPEACFRQNENHITITKNEVQDRKPASGQRFDPLAVEMPFPSEPFRTAWSDFCEHRRLIKHPLTEAAATRILRKLAGWGEPKAVEALDTSIENGWRGVFEPRQGKAGSNGQPHTCKVLSVEEYAGWNPYNGGTD